MVIFLGNWFGCEKANLWFYALFEGLLPDIEAQGYCYFRINNVFLSIIYQHTPNNMGTTTKSGIPFLEVAN